jgi:hypothetical protein
MTTTESTTTDETTSVASTTAADDDPADLLLNEDFSDPTSGWTTDEDAIRKVGYACTSSAARHETGAGRVRDLAHDERLPQSRIPCRHRSFRFFRD